MSACRGSCRTCSPSTCSASGESGSKLLVWSLSMCTCFHRRVNCFWNASFCLPILVQQSHCALMSGSNPHCALTWCICPIVCQAELLDAVHVQALFFVNAAGIWSSWRDSWRRTTQRSVAKWTRLIGRACCQSSLACNKRDSGVPSLAVYAGQL